jgi:transcriptional regulator with XRE-family HTH domain
MTEDRIALGAELKRIRQAAGLTTRQVVGVSSGHISNVETGRVLPSEKLLRIYASLGGRYAHLSGLLAKAKRPTTTGSRDDAELGAKLADLLTDPYLLRGGYFLESIEDSYYIGPNREPQRNVHRAAIRPTNPSTRYFPFRHSYEQDPRPGVCTITPADGCSIAHLEESDTGTIYAVLEFDPDQADELGRCTLSWIITLTSDVPVQTRMESGTRTRIPQAIQRIQFTPPALPAKVWRYRGFDAQIAGMNPKPDNTLELNPAHLYVHELINAHQEWWGLAWAWA